ncbi:alpha/beta hydrolase [Flavobacterium sp.]|uniref:alpha/beta hydrolase n=1 Tax=Flavobacterium sp. TaxID=239 RepID=UPI0039E2BA03
MEKIPVYFMPGLAASPSIFERIQLPEDQFEMIFLEWEIPLDNDSLSDYAQRIARKITKPNPVLVGVSFGGILVQEMAQFVDARKVIIISSVRCNTQFPRRMKVTKALHAYKLVPNNLVDKIEKLAKWSSNKTVKERMELYDRFLSVRDDRYLQWAIRNVVLWDRSEIDEKVVHIHGDADEIFPIRYIKNCHVVPGGTHIMILNRFRWINEHLPKIILDEI